MRIIREEALLFCFSVYRCNIDELKIQTTSAGAFGKGAIKDFLHLNPCKTPPFLFLFLINTVILETDIGKMGIYWFYLHKLTFSCHFYPTDIENLRTLKLDIGRMEILKADIEDNEILTSITKKSKAYWGFSEDILKEWDLLLTVSKDYIEKNEVIKLVQGQQIIGYYSYFHADERTIKLDNIFILPEFIGKGFGKILMNDFLKNVKKMRFDKITLDAEPNIENFYKTFGFETVGLLESSIKERYLPIMELKIENTNNS